MLLQSPPFDASSELGADWLELKALAAKEGKIAFSDIERVWERSRETEDTDFEGARTSFDDWLNLRIAHLQARFDTLGDSYPFEFLSDDREFAVKTSNGHTAGESVYLLCLFLSSFPETEIFSVTPKIKPVLRDLFQAASAWAAAGVVHGSAYAFGWPRPESTNFLGALRTVYETLMRDGEATVVTTAPPGSSGKEKDGGVDVIAWRERIDRHPGKIYFLGQVASGKNWRDKSIEEYVRFLHENWFGRPPVSTAMRGMFIPFSIAPQAGATISDQIRYESPRFGCIYYREVLPAYASKGLHLTSTDKSVHCHRSNEVPRLQKLMRRYAKLIARAQY